MRKMMTIGLVLLVAACLVPAASAQTSAYYITEGVVNTGSTGVMLGGSESF